MPGTPEYDPTYVSSPRIKVSILPTTLTVGTSPTALPSIPRLARKSLWIQNQSNNPIFIGDGSVTTSNGYQLNPFSDVTIPCEDSSVIQAVASSNGNQVWCGEGV